jgi:hypothetical protein
MSHVLIATFPKDLHAQVVAEALIRRGADPRLWYTPDFPNRAAETLRLGPRGASFGIEGLDKEADRVPWVSVWNRRVGRGLATDLLHPADRAVADKNGELFRDGFLQVIAPSALWVNPQHAVLRDSKPLQLERAHGLGFAIPETLITNDPDEIRSFLRRHPAVIHKPLCASFWRDHDHGAICMSYTTMLTEDMLVGDDILRSTPSIYQVALDKAYELRVTVIGDHVAAAAVLSQETRHGRTDWRRAYGELAMTPIELTDVVAGRCRDLVRAMGFVFGCCDLVVTPEGEYVFLEVNQAGQFLFVEEMTGLPLLDAMCELLIQGRCDFSWDRSRPKVRFDRELFEAADERRAQAQREHARLVLPRWVDAVAVDADGA